jgi:hypothetical protein
MKLWVFGDSFSIPSNFKHKDLWHYDENWIDIVARNLNLNKDDVNNFSQFGVSNEWIFKNVMEQSNSFRPKDYVILQLTNSNRHWWFPEHPALSNLTQSSLHPDWSKDKCKATELHLRYLQNDQMDNLIYSATIYSFLYIKLTLPGTQFLFLPGWATAPETIGNLTNNVCDAEFDDVDTQQKFYNKTGFDCRLNHMSINNHYVLADKIYDYFSNHIPVDLTTGFETNIYTKTNI